MPTHIAVLPADAQNSLQSSGLRPWRLPHPRTGVSALFILHGSALLEIHSINPDTSRSWFVDQSVVSDGKLILMTPINPTFLLIAFLRNLVNNSQRPFTPADDLVEEISAQYPQAEDVSRFLRLDFVQNALSQLCETKDIPPDIKVQRPSNDRIVAFLKRRVDRAVKAQLPCDVGPAFPTLHRQHLRLGLSVDELGPLTDPGAQSTRDAARIKIACEIVGTWVEEDLMNDVLKTYDISAYTAHTEVRAAQAHAELAAATARAEVAENRKGKGKDAGEKRKAAGQATRGVDKLKKANTKGMSSLTTFFGKKE